MMDWDITETFSYYWMGSKNECNYFVYQPNVLSGNCISKIPDTHTLLFMMSIFLHLHAFVYDKIILYSMHISYLIVWKHNSTYAILINSFMDKKIIGKSAHIGSHRSPDATEGLTPVSASIHVATMVTAGFFMIARFSPLFDLRLLETASHSMSSTSDFLNCA